MAKNLNTSENSDKNVEITGFKIKKNRLEFQNFKFKHKFLTLKSSFKSIKSNETWLKRNVFTFRGPLMCGKVTIKKNLHKLNLAKKHSFISRVVNRFGLSFSSIKCID